VDALAADVMPLGIVVQVRHTTVQTRPKPPRLHGGAAIARASSLTIHIVGP
jgi:hypothetical protein